MEEYKVYTYTIINVPTNEFKDKAPYLMAIVTNKKGSKFMTRIEGYDEGDKIKIGDKVKYKEKDSLGNIICKL